MIACIAPSDRFFEENVSTLNYATRASYIANAPTKNIDPKIKEILELKKKNKLLQLELLNANKHIEFLTSLTTEQLKVFGSNLISEKLDSTNEDSKLEPSSPIKTRGVSVTNTNPTVPKVQSFGTATGGISMGTSVGVSMGTSTATKSFGVSGATQTDTKMLLSTYNSKSARSQSKGPPKDFEKKPTKKEMEAKQEFEKKMNIITSEITIMGMNKEGNSNRFTDAMTRVTDLLKVNQVLRDENNAREDEIRKKNVELYQVKEESEELRDRIELLETIVQADSGTFEKYVSSHLFTQAQKNNMTDYMGYEQG